MIGDPGSMTLDGIFQTTRSALQLGVLESDPRVRRACNRLLATQSATKHSLNDLSHVMRTAGGNSHQLPNRVAAVAECATQFPEMVKTRNKWSCCARYV